jgi:hypothetical protein
MSTKTVKAHEPILDQPTPTQIAAESSIDLDRVHLWIDVCTLVANDLPVRSQLRDGENDRLLAALHAIEARRAA